MSLPASASHVCPRCSADAHGRFCHECGAPLGGAHCSGCRAPLTPGARFCHRCGAAAGTAVTSGSHGRSTAHALPWAIAGIALLALVSFLAAQRIGRPRTTAAAAAAAPGPASVGAVRAPDISGMSPQERANRLFTRVMMLHEQGRTDSVRFFAPMALASYQALDSLDTDQRYHLGRIGEVTGAVSLARAQADTILRARPDHLLGLILAADAARQSGDEARAREFDRRLIEAQERELRRALPEYEQHQIEIASAVADARRRSEL